MKVLFTHGYFLSDDPKEQQIMRPYPPLGLLYVAGHCRANGMEVTVHDCTFSSRGSLLQHITDFHPDAIAIYVNLMTRRHVVKLISMIRAIKGLSDVPIILGGPETRAHAQNFLDHGADICVLGEGETTALELLQHIQKEGLKKLGSINGIAFLGEDGNALITSEREKIKDIDTLVLPARDLIDINAYQQAWKDRHGHDALSVSTMRGCPYTCRWCSRAVYGLSYRRRSPEKVVDELAHLVEQYAPQRFWFVDDVFTVSHKWLEGFADELEKRELKINFECITRADRMNKKAIALLKKSGCEKVWIGAESGSQRIIDAMDRRVDVKQVREMIRAANKAGIGTGTFIMLGYPGETEADIEETIDHLKQSRPDDLTITVTYPIEGTELRAEIEQVRTTEPVWAESSDRDVDFKRTYPKRYYPYAVRRVVNEVKWDRARREQGVFAPAALGFKARSLSGKAGMWLMRTLG